MTCSVCFSHTLTSLSYINGTSDFEDAHIWRIGDDYGDKTCRNRVLQGGGYLLEGAFHNGEGAYQSSISFGWTYNYLSNGGSLVESFNDPCYDCTSSNGKIADNRGTLSANTVQTELVP